MKKEAAKKAKYEDSEHEALLKMLGLEHNEDREQTVARLQAALGFAGKHKNDDKPRQRSKARPRQDSRPVDQMEEDVAPRKGDPFYRDLPQVP